MVASVCYSRYYYASGINLSDSLLVTGSFAGPIYFSSGTQSPVSVDAFVAQYVPESGSLVGVQQWGGTAGVGSATTASKDAAGNLVVVGFFNTALNVGGTRYAATRITNLASAVDGSVAILALSDDRGIRSWLIIALDHDAVEKQRIVIDPEVYARIELGRCYIALTATTVLVDIETKVVGWNLATGAPVVTT